MRIFVDDRECPSASPDAAPRTIGEALAFASDLALSDRRRVVEVVIDGELWTDVQLGDSSCLGRSAETVHCTTACPNELLRDTFSGATAALVEIERLQAEAARLMQADESKRGMNTLLEALAMWSDIHGAATHGLAFGKLDSRDINTAEGTFEEAAHELQLRLSSLTDAMKRHDTVAVSDCLLYEFPATIRRWNAVLTELAHRAEAAMSTANLKAC